MISPFSHFSAFLVLPAQVLAKIVNPARVVTTAMNTRLSIIGVVPNSNLLFESKIAPDQSGGSNRKCSLSLD